MSVKHGKDIFVHIYIYLSLDSPCLLKGRIPMSMRLTKNILLFLLLGTVYGCGGGGGGGSTDSGYVENTVAIDDNNQSPSDVDVNSEQLGAAALQFHDTGVKLFYKNKSYIIPQEDSLYKKNSAQFSVPSQPEYVLSSAMPLLSFEHNLVDKKYENMSLNTVVYYHQGVLKKLDAETMVSSVISSSLNYSQAQTFCGFWDSVFNPNTISEHYFIYAVAKDGMTCDSNGAALRFYLASTSGDASYIPIEIYNPLFHVENGWVVAAVDDQNNQSVLYRCNFDCSVKQSIGSVNGSEPKPIKNLKNGLMRTSLHIFADKQNIFVFDDKSNTIVDIGYYPSFNKDTVVGEDDKYFYITESDLNSGGSITLIEKDNLLLKTKVNVADFKNEMNFSLPNNLVNVIFHDIAFSANYLYVLYSYAGGGAEKYVAVLDKTTKVASLIANNQLYDSYFVGTDFENDYLHMNIQASDGSYDGGCYKGTAANLSCHHGPYGAFSSAKNTAYNYVPIMNFSYLEPNYETGLFDLYSTYLCNNLAGNEMCKIGQIPPSSEFIPLKTVGVFGAFINAGTLYGFDFTHANTLNNISYQ